MMRVIILFFIYNISFFHHFLVEDIYNFGPIEESKDTDGDLDIYDLENIHGDKKTKRGEELKIEMSAAPKKQKLQHEAPPIHTKFRPPDPVISKSM